VAGAEQGGTPTGRCSQPPLGRRDLDIARGQCRPYRLAQRGGAALSADRTVVRSDRPAFAEISTRKEEQDGVPMLVIEGTIKSTSRRTADVPRLRFAVRNAQGQEIHSWTALPANPVLAPGDVLPFRTRLASPPPEAHAVLVRFFNRRDLVAGSQ
jgi:hypothetical protein